MKKRYLSLIGFSLLAMVLVAGCCAPPPPPVTKTQIEEVKTGALDLEEQVAAQNAQIKALEEELAQKEAELASLKEYERQLKAEGYLEEE
jgi:septal ring factor EnvC (AmiA/AmiB activator)